MIQNGWPVEAVDEAFRAVAAGQAGQGAPESRPTQAAPGRAGPGPAEAPPETAQAGFAPAEEEPPDPNLVLKRVFGVPLLLTGLAALFVGGTLVGPPLGLLLAGRPGGFALLAGGLALGAVGAGLLFAGLYLCWPKRGTRDPVELWRVLLFGLLWPGAAQAYARRWLPSALFLLAPWIIVNVILLVALLVGLLSGIAPDFARSAAKLLSAGIGVFRPGLVIYGLLWLGSLAEAYLWFSKLEENPLPKPIPRGKAPVIGLALIFYLFTFTLMFQAVLVGYTLKAGKAAKAAMGITKPSKAPGAE